MVKIYKVQSVNPVTPTKKLQDVENMLGGINWRKYFEN